MTSLQISSALLHTQIAHESRPLTENNGASLESCSPTPITQVKRRVVKHRRVPASVNFSGANFWR